jgi:hypothetical protein
MFNEAKISKEVVRLSQFRTRETGVPLKDELARQVVQEAIYNADPEAGLLLEEDTAYSSNDSLVSAFGVNDVVVNGKRLDVRAVEEDGRVTIARELIGTRYMTAGTMAVSLDKNEGGKVIGFIAAVQWEAADREAGQQSTVSLKASAEGEFDLAKTIVGASAAAGAAPEPAPGPTDMMKFMTNKADIAIEAQRKMVSSTLANKQSWIQLSEVLSTWSKGKVQTVLADGATWNHRVEKIAELAAPKFKRLAKEDIERVVAKLGETYGGQPESPAFRKALISTLTKEELTKLVSGATLKKASEVADAVLNGRAVTEVVKEIARNPVAVQIAGHIKRNRDAMGEFVDATTQEILGAFPQMSMRPVYTTHSAMASGHSLEPINEALKMLYAGELAKNARALDEELGNL